MDSKVEQLANSTQSHPCGHTSEVDNNSGAGPRDLSDNPSEGDCGRVSSMSPHSTEEISDVLAGDGNILSLFPGLPVPGGCGRGEMG